MGTVWLGTTRFVVALCHVLGLISPFFAIIRATTRGYRTRLRMCVQGTLRTRSNFAVMLINHGTQRASVALFSSHGPQFVRFLVLLPYSPQLKPHPLYFQRRHSRMMMWKKTRKATRTSGTETSGVLCGRTLVRAQPSILGYRPRNVLCMPRLHPPSRPRAF